MTPLQDASVLGLHYEEMISLFTLTDNDISCLEGIEFQVSAQRLHHIPGSPANHRIDGSDPSGSKFWSIGKKRGKLDGPICSKWISSKLHIQMTTESALLDSSLGALMEFHLLCRMEMKQKRNCTKGRVTRMKEGFSRFLLMIRWSNSNGKPKSFPFYRVCCQAARTMLFEAWLRSRETVQAGGHKTTLKHLLYKQVHLSVICMVTSRCVQIMSIISETPNYRRNLVGWLCLF